MLSGHRSAWRRRGRSSRAARIAVPLAIPMALGLTLGVVLAVSGGNATRINQSALGCGGQYGGGPTSVDPSVSAPAWGDSYGSPPAWADGNGNYPYAGSSGSYPGYGYGGYGSNGGGAGPGGNGAGGGGAAASAPASADPCPSADPTASTTASATASADPTTTADPTSGAAVPPADTFSSGQVASFQLGDLATDPVDGTGAVISLDQTAAEAATSMNCTLTVPNRPLTAQGLATPYQLGDGCTMADAVNEGAFVEATILAPDGSVQVYDPLVVTAGTTPAVAPVAPTIARGSQVIIDIGSNGNNLVLEGQGAQQGNCVDALGQSVIGQVSACNAVNFYRAANAMIAEGVLKVPALGTSDDGEPCETVRDFALIDQDQSDNVVTTYLINANGQTAQDTAANATSLTGATAIANGSDDRLLADFVDPANGCNPFSAPNSTYSTGSSGAQALNELSARVNQTGTIAVVPVNDEMTLVDNDYSIAKTNVYRSLVDQPLLAGNVNPDQVAADYCQNMVNIAPAHNELDMARELNFATPVPSEGVNLAAFMGARLSVSFQVLGCANFGLANPATLTTNSAGSATAVTYNVAEQTATGSSTATGTASPDPTAPATPTASATTGTSPGTWWLPRSRRGHHQNPAGM
ncbi:MAG TPA: hypothetical protein VME19_01245 [Streptosporangiaceae bacterium]|nr:hypothetical protein [Streptosporangiaceae bacterium]